VPVYEFRCPYGCIYEELVPIGTEQMPCPDHWDEYDDVQGDRILSATRTDFRYADAKLKK
jgi:hypothetical protein